VENATVRTADAAAVAVDLDGYVVARSKESQKAHDALNRVALSAGHGFVELDRCDLKGTAKIDSTTGLAVERHEELSARTVETFPSGSTQSLGYHVTTTTTCVRRAK
jgi:hypothetical protein